MALQHPINQNCLDELTDAQRDLIKHRFNDNDIVVYSLPGGNICVPVFGMGDMEEDSYTHVMNGKVSFYAPYRKFMEGVLVFVR